MFALRKLNASILIFGISVGASFVGHAEGTVGNVDAVSADLKEVTCYTLENQSNEFGIVRLNPATQSVVVTFYIANRSKLSSTVVMTEYDDNTIANFQKAGACNPVQKVTRQNGVTTLQFADACYVDDKENLVTTAGVNYKVDMKKKNGLMTVKNYDWAGAVLSERQYSFYNCF